MLTSLQGIPGIDHVTLLTLLLLLSIMLMSGLVHGTLGLGFPIIATPLLAMLTDVRSAVLITLLPVLTVNIASMFKGGQWQRSIGRFWPLAFFVALGSVLGTRLLIISDPAPFKLLLAVIILAYLYVQRLSPARTDHETTRPAVSFVLVGLLAGFLAGTVNVMVPVLIIFFLGMGLGPTATVQVFNLCFFAGKLTQVAVFAQAGMLDGDLLLATTPLAGAALIALLVGMSLRAKIDAETYRRWLRKVLLIIALILVAQYGVGH